MNAASLSISAASLSIFDWALLALLLASTIRAFLRGFLLEVFSLLGLLTGILLASWNYAALADWLAPLIHLGLATAGIVAFLLILSVTMLAASLAGKFLRSGASTIGLGLVDRSLGAVFGFARGCLAGIACLLLLIAFDPTGRTTRDLARNSRLLPYFLAGARGVSFVVPETLQRQLTGGADRITSQLKHNQPVWIKPPR